MATLLQKTMHVLKNDGVNGVIRHTKHFIKTKQETKKKIDTYKDILFINGCNKELLPHPARYRVTHQIEQLDLSGYTSDEIYYKSLQLNSVYSYRAFVIFRCVWTPQLDEFVKIAKQLNKTVFYDIDDLVIDTKYTDQIPYVMNMENKEQYDEDVRLMGKCLSLCDVCITTTECLKKELEKTGKPVIINRNSASIEMVQCSLNVKKEEHDTVKIGYFSGSITHNDDFNLILPVLKTILKEYKNVELHICGQLQIDDLKDQIVIHPFMDYRKLPELISQMDINLAPLNSTLFNEAKSENKWVEASLVKTCTIASNTGAFKECIQHGKTGFLCDEQKDWLTCLRNCIESKELRNQIAQNAYDYCIKKCTTMYTAHSFVEKIKPYIHKNICFAVSKMEISGGILVALHHMKTLQKNGYDVSILSLYDTEPFFKDSDCIYPILPIDSSKLNLHIDTAIATMWVTVSMIENISCIDKRMYLVQNFETDFYDFSDPLKRKAQQSYDPRIPFTFLTVSKWCQKWLKDDFHQESLYIPNGIERNRFNTVNRNWNGKIRILIEGDCEVAHKNVDESFQIINQLDLNRFEIWYMSYNAKPKDWYHVDRFFHRIPYHEVPSIYKQCHILLKTSLLESFSYPPLEMMATGGCVVALANDGNIEYLKNEVNCLFYPEKNLQEAKNCIYKIIEDENLRNRLIENGIKCADERNWEEIEKDIMIAYQ